MSWSHHYFVPPGEMPVGTCGNCGGAVSTPTVWLGVKPPVPQCTRCGVTPASGTFGPRIPMHPTTALRFS